MITAFLYLSPSTRRFFLPERETDQGKPSGFTLVELLVAMCVSLLLLGGVVSLFGSLGESVNNSKSNSEMLQTMRHTARQLQSDLGNVSLVPDPAQTMVDPQGFFEYVEGPQNDANLKPEPVAELPDPIILDDGGSSFTAVSDGTNNIFKPFTSSRAKRKSYSNTVHEKNSRYLKNEGLFEATGLENGTYKVSLTWPIEWNTSDWASKTETSVPVSVSSGGAAPQATTVDQSQAPSSFDDPEGEVNDYGEIIKWQDIGEVDVTNGEITVQIGPCGVANGYTTSNMRVFADAIRIECLELN
jgi:prepilin-type N-terminal cleavage/methylation domain-containing protein